MKLTRTWLQNYVDISSLTNEELADHLTMRGLEVDSLTPMYEDLAPLRTGLVLSAVRHPAADKLTLCQVQVGDQQLAIVCGAPNVREGLRVVVALPGTLLPGNVKISRSKIRGVESFGMICSEREIGLGNDHDGIMELPEHIAHGQPFIEAMALSDLGIEVDLTPNRSDCLSVIGIARELAAVVDRPLTLPIEGQRIDRMSENFSVAIDAADLCPRYCGRLVRGIRVGPSPWWLRRRLLSVGLRPINNIVDITNFVMLEYGQPLHAFDFTTLAGSAIIVRRPRPEERLFTTLDRAERHLDPDTLLICDRDKPVALAGVMGGLNSEVTEKTVDVLVESACFNPVSIRRTARRLNLSSDASYRFERGVDPQGTVNALNRAVALITEIAGGTAADEGVDCFPGLRPPPTITLNIDRCNRLLGITLPPQSIAALLASIGIPSQPGPKAGESDQLLITPPSFRVDIEREADLIEEVARLYGYNRIPITLPRVGMSYPEEDPDRRKRLDIAGRLTAIGFHEAINYSFIADKHAAMLDLPESDPRRSPLALLNPLSEEQAVLRTTLLPGLLDNVRRNLSYQQTAIRLFELGKVFFPTEPGKQPVEKHRLSGVLAGNRHGEAAPLHFPYQEVDLLDGKGAVEYLIGEMHLATVDRLPPTTDGISFHPLDESSAEPFAEPFLSLELRCAGKRLGTTGQMRTEVLRRFGIKHQVIYFDLDFDALCTLAQMSRSFTSLPVFPAVQRDIALLLPEEVQAGELTAAVRNSADPLIERCEIFDVFQGGKIPRGQKSVALTLTYRSAKKTLTEKNVEKSHKKIVELLTGSFGGSIRHE